MESVNVNKQHEQGHYQSGDVDALDYMYLKCTQKHVYCNTIDILA